MWGDTDVTITSADRDSAIVLEEALTGGLQNRARISNAIENGGSAQQMQAFATARIVPNHRGDQSAAGSASSPQRGLLSARIGGRPFPAL
jgi:hypothetical protein